jgi:hypothetical protein
LCREHIPPQFGSCIHRLILAVCNDEDEISLSG